MRIALALATKILCTAHKMRVASFVGVTNREALELPARPAASCSALNVSKDSRMHALCFRVSGIDCMGPIMGREILAVLLQAKSAVPLLVLGV